MNPPLKRVASMTESILSVFTFADAIALFLMGFERTTRCLSERSLWAQYQVDEDSMAMDDCAGMLSVKVFIFSSVVSILRCLSTLLKVSLVTNSVYLLL